VDPFLADAGISPPEPTPPSESPPPVDRERRDTLLWLSQAALLGLLGATVYTAVRGWRPTTVAPYAVNFAISAADSSWHNDLAGLPIRPTDFPRAGLGAMGVIPRIGTPVVVLRLDPAFVDFSKTRFDVAGFVAYDARCTFAKRRCTTLWRDAVETGQLSLIEPRHDYMVCPCCLATFDPYEGMGVEFGPAPAPLSQLYLSIEDDRFKVRFPKP